MSSASDAVSDGAKNGVTGLVTAPVAPDRLVAGANVLLGTLLETRSPVVSVLLRTAVVGSRRPSELGVARLAMGLKNIAKEIKHATNSRWTVGKVTGNSCFMSFLLNS